MAKDPFTKMAEVAAIGTESWLKEKFPEKDWHKHRRSDGRFDLCDGTPSDCESKPVVFDA